MFITHEIMIYIIYTIAQTHIIENKLLYFVQLGMFALHPPLPKIRHLLTNFVQIREGKCDARRKKSFDVGSKLKPE